MIRFAAIGRFSAGVSRRHEIGHADRDGELLVAVEIDQWVEQIVPLPRQLNGTSSRLVQPDNRPAWCGGSSAWAVPDSPERPIRSSLPPFARVLLFYEGKGKVRVGDEISYVQAGDVVCTPAGAAHDIVEFDEELEGFYLEEPLPDEGSIGPTLVTPKGMRSPSTPLPDDFPPATRAGVIVS